MTAPKLAYIPDILEEHFEELQFLWGQRRRALQSPLYTMRELGMLEERIDAHVHGLLVVGERMMPLAEQALAGDGELSAFAAAYPLLCLHTESATARVLDAFSAPKKKQLRGLRDAMCQGPVNHILPRLTELFGTAAAPVAAAAAEALAFHSVFSPKGEQLLPFLRDELPAVRQSGWRLVSYLAVPMEPKTYAAAMRDEDEGVRRAAIAAAAWSGVPGILVLARQSAEQPDPANAALLEILAVLGTAEDVPRIAAIVATKELGPERFALAGSFGHPALMDMVLDALSDPDAATAGAAGAAFTRMAGQNVDSGTRGNVVPPGAKPDAFEEEFLDEVMLPNPELARNHWDKVGPRFGAATRLCRGFDVSRGADRESFGQLDMQSRWEICLRGRFHGVWQGSPMNLEVFPQQR